VFTAGQWINRRVGVLALHEQALCDRDVAVKPPRMDLRRACESALIPHHYSEHKLAEHKLNQWLKEAGTKQ